MSTDAAVNETRDFVGRDAARAVGVALAILVVNVALSFVVIGVYASLIEPGRDDAFYEAAAQQLAPWSSVFVGALLFFVALYALTRRTPRAWALRFALAVAGAYAVIDLAIVGAAGSLASIAGIVALSLTTKFLAACAGAALGSSRS